MEVEAARGRLAAEVRREVLSIHGRTLAHGVELECSCFDCFRASATDGRAGMSRREVCPACQDTGQVRATAGGTRPCHLCNPPE